MFKILTTLTLLLGSSYAAIFNVNNTVEFRQALSDAAGNGENDTIILVDAVYKTTDDGMGTFTFLDNEPYTLTLIGSSRENVILSGDNQHQVFKHNSTVDAHLKLEKLSIVNGYDTTVDGGGVFTDFSIEVLDCNFTNNHGYFGGGFYSGNSTSINTKVTNTIFQNNRAMHYGAGFMAYGTSTTISNSIFIDNNSSSYGGGFSSSAKSISVVDTSFFNNYSGNRGGAINTGTSSHTLEVKNSEFIDNIARRYGGAIHAYGASATISNSIFEGNIAMGDYGGGINVSGGNTSSLNIINSIFTKNSAGINGGAVYAYLWSELPLQITNSLFSHNLNGVYMQYGETNIIVNSIFKDNNDSAINGGSGAILTLKNSYINPEKIDISYFNSNNIFTDIILGFLDETKGDYHLISNSNLIDTGLTTDPDIIIPTIDLDTNPRPVGASTDIGPYEYQLDSVAPAIPTDVNASDGTIEFAVGISWIGVTNVNYYNIYRSVSQSDIGEIVGVITGTSFIDDTVEENTKYYYHVNACNDKGCSDYSIVDSGYIGIISSAMNPAIIIYLLN